MQPEQDRVDDVFAVVELSALHDAPLSPRSEDDRVLGGAQFSGHVDDRVLEAEAVFDELDAVERLDGGLEECKKVCLSNQRRVVPNELQGVAVERVVRDVADPTARVFGRNVRVDGRHLACPFVGVLAAPCFVVQKEPEKGLNAHTKGPDAVVGLLLLGPLHQVFAVFRFDGNRQRLHARGKVLSDFDRFQLKGNVRAGKEDPSWVQAKVQLGDAF